MYLDIWLITNSTQMRCGNNIAAHFRFFVIMFLSFLWTDPCRADGRELYFESVPRWERYASLEAVKRYKKFLENNPLLIGAPEKKNASIDSRYNGKSPFFIYSRPSGGKFYRHQYPAGKEIGMMPGPITCAQNEWESLQIGIWAHQTIDKFSYELTDFVYSGSDNPDRGIRPKIRTYYAYNILARKKVPLEISPDMDIDPESIDDDNKFYYSEEPVVLLNLPDITIEKGTGQAFWIDIFVPKNTAPGPYQSEIHFKIDGKTIQKKAVILEVLPFELDTADDWSRGAYISKFLDEKEVINLVENGHNQVSWWTSSGYKISVNNGRITADFSSYSRYLKLLDHKGMTGPHVVFLGGDSPKLINRILSLLDRKGIHNGRNIKYRKQYLENDRSAPFESYFIQTLNQYRDQMRDAGHGNILSVILDEPDHKPGPERLDWYNDVYSIVEKNIPDLPTMGVFYHKGDEKKLSHHHSVWSTNRPSKKLLKACKKAGQKLYTYVGGYRFYDAPGKYRFDVGIIPWVYDAAGTFYWAIWNHSESERHLDDIFSPDTFAGRATTIARAPAGEDYGPLSTLVHKGFREAVDDARYIKTLEKLINKAKGSVAEPEAERHRIWLDNIRHTLRKKLYVRGGHVYNHKRFTDWHFPVASLTFSNSLGEKRSLENLEVFSRFIREDIRRRIMSLLKQMSRNG